MSAVTPPDTPQISRTRYLPLAVGASVVHMVMMIPGFHEDGSFDTGGWFSILVFSVVVSVLVFMLVVPRAGDTAGVVLGVIALVSVLAFWAGLTLPLAAAAGAIGWKAKQAGHLTMATKATLAFAVLSAVALVAIIISDAAAN